MGERENHEDEAGEADTADTGGGVQREAMDRIGFAPIVRVDAARREIELCATSEAMDSHGTIFDYDASREAFTRWVGNVREMHGRMAVGSRVAVRCDDATRRIYVRIRVSRGAQDTWEKVVDGTLRGASIGASGVVWRRQRRRVAGAQRLVNVATRYDLVELSLVDNPSNPDALGISFVRDATPDAALLDLLDEPDASDASVQPDEPQSAIEGHAPVAEQVAQQAAQEGQENRAARERFHGAARAVLLGCGCSTCAAAQALLTDVDAAAARAVSGNGQDVRDVQDGRDEQPMARALAAGLSESSMRLVALDAGVRALATTIETALRRVSGEVGGLAQRVVALESQPVAGGPVARPMEKSSPFATRSQAGVPSVEAQYHALESLAGRLRDPQAQVAVAAELIRLQQQGE